MNQTEDIIRTKWKLTPVKKEELTLFIHEVMKTADFRKRDTVYSVLYMFQLGILAENPKISPLRLFQKSLAVQSLDAGYDTWGWRYIWGESLIDDWPLYQSSAFLLFVQYTAITVLGYDHLPTPEQCLNIITNVLPMNHKPFDFEKLYSSDKPKILPARGITPEIRKALEEHDAACIKLQCDLSKKPESMLKNVYHLIFQREDPIFALDLNDLCGGLDTLIPHTYLRDFWTYWINRDVYGNNCCENPRDTRYALFMLKYIGNSWSVFIHRGGKVMLDILKEISPNLISLDISCSSEFPDCTIRDFIRLWDEFGKYFNDQNIDSYVKLFHEFESETEKETQEVKNENGKEQSHDLPLAGK